MFRNPSAKSVRGSLASFSIATSYANLGDAFFAFISFDSQEKKRVIRKGLYTYMCVLLITNKEILNKRGKNL